MADKSLIGIGLFQYCIIHLISIGKKEDVNKIEDHFESRDLVEYLYNKYKSDFLVPYDNSINSIYNNDSINAYFEQYGGWIKGEESRKYGVVNKDDGLLLVLALIADKIEKECFNWSISE